LGVLWAQFRFLGVYAKLIAYSRQLLRFCYFDDLRLSLPNSVKIRCISEYVPLSGYRHAPNRQIVKFIAIKISESKKAIVLGVFIRACREVTPDHDASASSGPSSYFPFSLGGIKTE
jgi:hypothetical protein